MKWKGYPESENSWVRESDAPYVSVGLAELVANRVDLCRNANELMSQFLDKKKERERAAEKKKASARHRKSLDRPQEPKKRGRASTKPKIDSDEEESERSPVQPIAKKQKKGSASSKNKKDREKEESDMGQFTSMEKYMHLNSWDDLVAKVETIEKDDEGSLYLYGILYDFYQALKPERADAVSLQDDRGHFQVTIGHSQYQVPSEGTNYSDLYSLVPNVWTGNRVLRG